MPNFASNSRSRSSGNFSAPVTTIFSERSCSGFALRRKARRKVGVVMRSCSLWRSIVSTSFWRIERVGKVTTRGPPSSGHQKVTVKPKLWKTGSEPRIDSR